MKIRKSYSDSNVQYMETKKNKLIKDVRFFLHHSTDDCIELISDILLVERTQFSQHLILAENIDKKLHSLSVQMLEYIFNIVVKHILH